MFTYLLNQRLGHWCENNNILSEAQFAYKPGYGTTDAIFVLKMLLDIHSSGMHLAFIDFSKAFDNVNRNLLYEKLISHGISSKFLKMIESMYSKKLTAKLKHQMDQVERSHKNVGSCKEKVYPSHFFQ